MPAAPLFGRRAQRQAARQLGAQRGRLQRFVEEGDIGARGRVAHLLAAFGGGQNRRDGKAEALAQRGNRGEPIAFVQVIVCDDRVRRALQRRERFERLVEPMRGGDAASPFAQQHTHAVEHARLVVDRQDAQAVQRLARQRRLRQGRVGGEGGARHAERRDDREHRTDAGLGA